MREFEFQAFFLAALVCAAVVYFKLEKLFPSGAGVAFSADENERKQGLSSFPNLSNGVSGGKNLFRCVLVAIMGTAMGIVFFFTLPDLISTIFLHKPLPFWIYDNQVPFPLSSLSQKKHF